MSDSEAPEETLEFWVDLFNVFYDNEMYDATRGLVKSMIVRILEIEALSPQTVEPHEDNMARVNVAMREALMHIMEDSDGKRLAALMAEFGQPESRCPACGWQDISLGQIRPRDH